MGFTHPPKPVKKPLHKLSGKLALRFLN